MDVSTIERAITAIGQQINGIVDALVPVALPITQSLTVLSVIFLGVALVMGGQIVISSILRVTAAATLTNWAIQEWSTIVLGTLRSSRAIIGLLIPGYAGPAHLLDLAVKASGRMEIEHISFSFGGLVDLVVGTLASGFVLIGLAVPGVLAVLAEVLLLLGAAIAPLLLPGLAFAATSEFGWGPIRFLLQASVRVIMMGVASHVVTKAYESVVVIPGGTDSFAHEDISVMLILSMIAMAVGFSIPGIARDSLGGGGPGSLGMSSIGNAVHNTTAVVGSAAEGAGAATGAAVKGGAAALRGGASMASKMASSSSIGALKRATTSTFRS